MSTPSDTREPGRAFAQCAHEPRAPAWLLTAAAGLLHLALFAAALYLSAPAPSHARTQPAERALLEVELSPPAPPAQERAPEAAAPPPEPEPAKLKVARVALPPPPPPASEPPPPAEPPAAEPPPAAAQASAALTASDESAPAANDTLVTGEGPRYAGGTTERGGTSSAPVHAPNARAAGVPNGTGDTPVDQSREPRLASGTDWSCPFPEEAVEDGIERATVRLEVEVSASGSLIGVTVREDPGSGFGREARACALKKRWLPALDRNGQPTQRKHPVNVTFTQR